MSGDPAVVEEVGIVPAALSAANLLTAVAVKLPSFWPYNIETWLIQLPAVRPSLTPSRSWISSELLLPLILINTLRPVFSGCML